MIDFLLNAMVAVIVVSTIVIFPVFQALRSQELATSQQPPVWYKGKPLVMVLIGLACAAVYGLMVMELDARISQTSVVVIGAFLLLLPTSVVYVTLLALYHIVVWIRRR